MVEQPEGVRAIVQAGYGGVEVWSLGRAAVPAPKAGEVLLRVHAAGMDRGTWHLMTGLPYPMRLAFGFSAPKFSVPGRDVAGTVLAVGPGVDRLQPGDEVFGIAEGSFAEQAVAREDKLAKKPGSLSFTEAAVLGISGLTALQALDAAKVAAGDSVLVLGASGGVGSYAVQLARARGARVTAVCGASKAERVRAWGAERVIDYRTEDVMAGDARFDVVIDVAGNTPLGRLRGVLTEKGRVVFVGGEEGGDWTGGLGRPLFASMLGAFTGQKFVMFMAEEKAADLERLAALVAEGHVRPVVHSAVPLADTAGAMRALIAGEVCGKQAIVVD